MGVKTPIYFLVL